MYQMTHIKIEKAVKQTLLSNCTTSILCQQKMSEPFSLRISKYVLAMTNSYAIILNYSNHIYFSIFSTQLSSTIYNLFVTSKKTFSNSRIQSAAKRKKKQGLKCFLK